MPRVVGEMTIRGNGQCKGVGRALVGIGVAGKLDRSKERERVGASAIFPLECFVVRMMALQEVVPAAKRRGKADAFSRALSAD